MSEREQTLQMVSDAITPLRRIDELYYTALNLEQQSAVYAAMHKTRKDKEKANKSHNTRDTVCIAFMVSLAILVKLFQKLRLSGFFEVFFAIVALACSAFFAYCVYKRIKGKENTNIEDSATDLVADNEQKIEQISNEIERVATEGADHINQLPRDYRNYNAAQFFESALANGRADNMKEAVNLYEDELHKMRLENMSAQTLRASEQQARMLASIEESSRVTANVSKANLVFNVLAFLDRV